MNIDRFQCLEDLLGSFLLGLVEQAPALVHIKYNLSHSATIRVGTTIPAVRSALGTERPTFDLRQTKPTML